jgi:IS605 OrfB family transposase
MKTLIFKINISDEDKKIISSLQNDYSISFRKMYNNIELMKDINFLNTLRIKSKKQIEYLQKEVISFFDRNETNKLKIKSNISVLEKYDKLSLKQFKHLQYLKKSLNKNNVFGDKKELVRLSKGDGDKDIWKKSRLLPLVFYGETARNGNRFFKLDNISKGKILFKLESTDIKIPISFKTKKHLNILEKLNIMLSNKELPITIKLTSEKMFITFDESIVARTNLDIKSFYKEIKHIKDKEERKKLIHNKRIEHENKLKKGKLDRYLGIDLNPDGIGYCVLTKDLTIIDKGYIDISRNIRANKRRYETSIMIKELFKLIKHYNCHTIVTEELNMKNTDLGNRVSNRKVNNLWNKTLMNEIIKRKCNEEGVIQIEVNPVYSSFIGNIIHKEYDPIAASLEVCRRGVNKYSKGGFYPELDITNFINDERYNEIKECLTWKDLYSFFITSKRSYRRKLNNFNFVEYYLGNKKSGMKHLHFL